MVDTSYPVPSEEGEGMSRADYEHWNEDAEYIWWQEEGKHETGEPSEADYCDVCGIYHRVGACDE